jgi:hypothetical protein
VQDTPILKTPVQAAEDANDQLNTAIARLNQVNKALPQPIMPNLPQIELTAGVDALVKLLIDAEIIDEHRLIEAKCLRMAEIVEQILGQALEQHKPAGGLVIAQPGPIQL